MRCKISKYLNSESPTLGKALNRILRLKKSCALIMMILPGYILLLGLLALVPELGNAVASVTSRNDASWFINMDRFSESAHGFLECEACHKEKEGPNAKHPDLEEAKALKRKATRIYDYSQCKSCHRNSYDRYLLGEHAKALKEEQKGDQKTPAPTCGECHSVHYERSHLYRVELGRKMTEICGLCHPAQRSTYLEDYHGKTAVNLGNENSAYCTDCHGAHRCISLKDKEAALRACRSCHPEAGEKFVEFVIHPTTKDLEKEDKEKKSYVALIKIVATVMAVLVVAIVGFFYSHSFIWLLREIHEKLRKH